MKYLIAIASLLAAGTAFANADQNLTIDSSTTGNFDKLNGNGNTVCNITVTENASIGRIDGSSIYNLKTITLTLNDSVNFSISNDAKLPYNNTSNTYSTTVTLGDNSKFTVGGVLYFGSRNSSYTGITQNTSIAFGSGSSITAGTVSTVAASGGKSYLTVSVDYVAAMLASSYAWDLITTTNGFTNYTSDAITLSNISALDNVGYTNAGVLASADDLGAGQYGLVFANNKLSFVSSVPEPSAFGLLAGVGALAFVAARRRRRAK